ncbi:hypothetical protein ABZ461_06495 [Actinacidiphila glaucinigra]|uniref:hypothetical protein n=1 Tax=Actinacidiphila glaucinigra TaxID=235986 RepID=UPI0033F7FE42
MALDGDLALVRATGSTFMEGLNGVGGYVGRAAMADSPKWTTRSWAPPFSSASPIGVSQSYVTSTTVAYAAGAPPRTAAAGAMTATAVDTAAASRLGSDTRCLTSPRSY